MGKTILNVLYQSSDYYALPTGISLTSLLMNNRDIDEINIYLLDDGISDGNLSRFQNLCNQYKRRLIILPTASIKERVVSLGLDSYNGSYATYYKLFALDSIDPPTDLILYLDGDTIIDKSLNELIAVDFCGNEFIAAVYELYLNTRKQYIGMQLDEPYYNEGVFLVKPSEWRNRECLKQIIEFVRREGNCSVADQDMMNLLFRNMTKPVSLTYNFNTCFFLYGAENAIKLYDLEDGPYYTPDQIKAVMKEGSCIYHCLGNMEGRPWEKGNNHPMNNLFDKYKEQSFWADTSKYEVTRNQTAKLQWALYRILPRPLYLKVHKAALSKYLKMRDA